MADKLGGNAIKSNTIPANRAVNNSLSYSNFDSQVKAFVDGIQVASTYSSTQNFTNSVVRIGYGANGNFTGYIQDVRVTRGIARYVQNFTPPTTAFLTR